jgi:hypothetical protein
MRTSGGPFYPRNYVHFLQHLAPRFHSGRGVETVDPAMLRSITPELRIYSQLGSFPLKRLEINQHGE